ncbi:MAG TPA: ArsA-related P-loop ATPase [Acidimicrobiales bacterium]|nr:ArsA-related P-loop ATPase [Acidimicrobiales bacterium]
MDPAQFFSASRVVIVAGKGGVGKTVVAAAFARAAAGYGLATTIIEIEGRNSVAPSFDAPLFGYDEIELARGDKSAGRAPVRGRTITPDLALIEYLEDHGLRRVARRMASTGVLEVVATATPGIKDLLVLGKVKHLEQSRHADLLVLDAPAAGHALSFLDAARVLHDTAKVGPIHHQAVEVLAMLRDPARAQVILVTLAEETPINELIETAYRLEDQLRVSLGPVVVNGVLPALADIERDPADLIDAAIVPKAQLSTLREAGRWWATRYARQREELARLAEALPLPQIELPQLFGPTIGSAESVVLTDALVRGVNDLDG